MSPSNVPTSPSAPHTPTTTILPFHLFLNVPSEGSGTLFDGVLFGLPKSPGVGLPLLKGSTPRSSQPNSYMYPSILITISGHPEKLSDVPFGEVGKTLDGPLSPSLLLGRNETFPSRRRGPGRDLLQTYYPFSLRPGSSRKGLRGPWTGRERKWMSLTRKGTPLSWSGVESDRVL